VLSSLNVQVRLKGREFWPARIKKNMNKLDMVLEGMACREGGTLWKEHTAKIKSGA
jgi:hypothetical protein